MYLFVILGVGQVRDSRLFIYKIYIYIYIKKKLYIYIDFHGDVIKPVFGVFRIRDSWYFG